MKEDEEEEDLFLNENIGYAMIDASVNPNKISKTIRDTNGIVVSAAQYIDPATRTSSAYYMNIDPDIKNFDLSNIGLNVEIKIGKIIEQNIDLVIKSISTPQEFDTLNCQINIDGNINHYNDDDGKHLVDPPNFLTDPLPNTTITIKNILDDSARYNNKITKSTTQQNMTS